MARVKQTVEGRGTPMRDPLDGDSLDLSVVVPVCNEEDNVAELSQRLSAVLGARVERYEVIFVDDGSTDRSFHAIQQPPVDEDLPLPLPRCDDLLPLGVVRPTRDRFHRYRSHRRAGGQQQAQ